jgi:outer membrane receptor protein involved in Fe transport
MTKRALLATVAVLMPGVAFAQAAPANTNAAAAAADANEIVITATRRAQLLSDVPIAVSAVSGEQLRNSGATDLRQLNQLAPSLLVSTATNESNGAARIRGIGTVGENPGLESSVALFIDGVYRSRTGVGLTDLGELDRVEVLRGPQGTLFGRNASAGLISITTALPKFETGGTAEVSYGNYNAWRVLGSVTGPINDKLAVRLDGVWNKRDGFLTDVISGRSLQNKDRYLLRGQMLFKPTEDISFRLIADYSHKSEECCGASILEPLQNLSRDPTTLSVVSSPNTLAQTMRGLGAVIVEPTDGSKFARQTAITPGVSFDQRTKDWGVSGELNWDFGGAKLTSITAYRDYKNNGAQDGDFGNLDILNRTTATYREFKTFSQELRLQGQAFDNRLDWLVGGYYADEKLTLHDDLKFGADAERFGNCLFSLAFGGPALVNTSDPSCFNRTAAAASPSALVKGLAGLAPLGAGGFNPAGGWANAAAGIGFTPGPGGALFNGTGVNDTFEQKSRNYAFFTHDVISIVPDKLLLTIGVRYTNERKELDATFLHTNTFCNALRASSLAALSGLPCAINGLPGPGFKSSDPGATKSESKWSGTVVLSFKPTSQILTYASYSRGYKAGGFNLDTAALTYGAASATQLQFEPETVNAYEIGAKFDSRQFKVNAALFYEEFSDFQLNLFNGVNFQVTNIEACQDDLGGRDKDLINGNSTCPAGRNKHGVTAKGLELEGVFQPVADLAISAGLTIADTKYGNNLTGVNGSSLGAALFQLPGSTISNASRYTATGSIAYSPTLTNGFGSLFYVDFRTQSALNTGSDLDYEKIQPAFTVVNARIGIYAPDKRWGIELWGQNLFNTLYQQIAADAPAQGSGTFRQTAQFGTAANQIYITFPAEPRTYGVTLRTRF